MECAVRYGNLEVPYFEQKDSFWCGPACLSMVGGYYQKSVSQLEIADRVLRNQMSRTRDLAKVARTVLGLDAKIQVNASIEALRCLVDLGLPPIVLQQLQLGSDLGHFRVVTNVRKNEIIAYDPMFGYDLSYSIEEFSALWNANRQTQESGVLLSIVPQSQSLSARQHPVKSR